MVNESMPVKLQRMIGKPTSVLDVIDLEITPPETQRSDAQNPRPAATEESLQ